MSWSGNKPLRAGFLLVSALSLLCFFLPCAGAQETAERLVTGVVVNEHSDAVVGATVSAQSASKSSTAVTDGDGAFSFHVPSGPITLTVTGPYIAHLEQHIAAEAPSQNLRMQIRYAIPRTQETLVITATALDPSVDRRNDAVYQNTLFSRDDQLMDTLASGINAGQHEGGGKSIEVRRFGFNLDHGGTNGGLKVLVDDVPQNQSTQGHGQGYLGSLKSLSPELVEDVDILNGPFRAEYGDFSGLGVVHIRTKERLPDRFTLRAQGGSFGALRTFTAWSPRREEVDAYVAWEHAYTDGPFKHPLHYVRDNFAGSYKFRLNSSQTLGVKFNGGRNQFDSSGQIPLDEVAARQLDRYGYIDPSDGGRVRSGMGSLYYKNDFASGDQLRVDGFVSRSLFDLFSNFTFFLRDPVNGDGIQQHDSRLQEGSSTQYLHNWKLLGHPALLTLGTNFNDSQLNVDLFHTKDRVIIAPTTLIPQTEADAHVTNVAFYAQQGFDFPHLHVDAGLRFDQFRFKVKDRMGNEASGLESAGLVQPKLNVMWTPFIHVPVSLYTNYGRGISSQDARGIVLHPSYPKVATTDFYQLGTSNQLGRFALATDVFLIDHSHAQVYVPDDGTLELAGPSRSYGWEAKTSIQIYKALNFNGGITHVSNAFYRGTSPREYVEAAPHTVANTAVTLAAWHGFFGSLTYRHVSGYRLDKLDSSIHAAGLDVVDLAVSKKLAHGLEASLSIDNLNNKRYYETQNYFEAQTSATDARTDRMRVCGTPGYPIGVTLGLTWRIE